MLTTQQNSTKLYPIAKRIDGRSLGAQAPSRTRRSGLPKNEIFWDGSTAQAEHRSNEPTNFLRSGIDDLKLLFTAGRLAQAYLLYGLAPAKSLPLAIDLAAHVLTASARNPCGFGPDTSKKFIQQNTHPNFFLLTNTEEDKEIVVENARAMSLFLQSTPTIPGWRFVIISPADRLNNAGSNAILKILEELPEKVTIVLVANGMFRIKPTILSRVQKVFLLEERKTIQQYLQQAEHGALAREIVANLQAAIEGVGGRASGRIIAKFPNKTLVDAIANNGAMQLFRNIVLTFLYEQVFVDAERDSSPNTERGPSQNAEREAPPNVKRDPSPNTERGPHLALLYEKVMAFIIAAENKSLSPTHFINSVFAIIAKQKEAPAWY
jgi:hypothetical protein